MSVATKAYCNLTVAEIEEQYGPEHAARRQATKTETAKRKYWRNRAVVDEWLSQGCVDCGESYPPEVMQADHVRGQKSFVVSQRLNSLSTDAVRAELAKCEPRCPNCHALRHYREARGL